MDHTEFDADDPFEMVGMSLDAEPGTDPEAEMARVFVEEFLRMGRKAEDVMTLFDSPFYRLTHDVLLRRGRPWVAELVGDVTGRPASDFLCLPPRTEPLED